MPKKENKKLGKPPAGSKQVRHKDCDPANNRIDNLEWDVCAAYFMPQNIKARELFDTTAEKEIDIFIKQNYIKQALDYIRFDVDDYKQLCLWKIWRNIDSYPENISFYFFCATKCKDVFYAVYRKEVKKRYILYEDLATEKKPLDHLIELSYEMNFDFD